MEMRKVFITSIEENPSGYIKALKKFTDLTNELFDKTDGYIHIDFDAKTFDDAKEQMEVVVKQMDENGMFMCRALPSCINADTLPKKYQDKENFLDNIYTYCAYKYITPYSEDGKYKSIEVRLIPEIHRGNMSAKVVVFIYFYTMEKSGEAMSYFVRSLNTPAGVDKALGMNYAELKNICDKYGLNRTSITIR